MTKRDPPLKQMVKEGIATIRNELSKRAEQTGTDHE